MRIGFLGKEENNELKMLFPRALIIDAAIYLVTLPFYGFTAEIPLGLLLGTAACFLNLIILGFACAHAVERPLKAAKRFMFTFYLIRMTLLGAAIVAGFEISFINPICVCIPLFYPKAIYTVRALRKKT